MIEGLDAYWKYSFTITVKVFGVREQYTSTPKEFTTESSGKYNIKKNKIRITTCQRENTMPLIFVTGL